MPSNDPDLGLILMLFRRLRGFQHQADLAEAAGTPASVISDYENGVRKPQLRNLDRLLETLGLEPAAIDATRDLLKQLRGVVPEPKAPPGDGRAATAALVARLCRYPKLVQKALAAEAKEFQTSAVVELLCNDNLRLVRQDARLAIDRAELAVAIVARVPGPRTFRLHASSQAWAILANARKVIGDSSAAELALQQSDRLAAKAGEAPPGLLSDGKIVQIEASLRRLQKRYEESLQLFDRALTRKPDAQLQIELLVGKAMTKGSMGDLRGAIGVLAQVQPLVLRLGDSFLRFVWAQNQLNLLFQTGRIEEAVALAPEARRLAQGVSFLDQLRLMWLEGRLLGALGKGERAIRVLSQVRNTFLEKRMSYDASLVSGELSKL